MASRSGIVYQAMQRLQATEKQLFLSYADELTERLPADTTISFPPPPQLPYKERSPAEARAVHYLASGSGSIWTAVRETVALLDYTQDGRSFANGLTYGLGAFCKGGLLGLCRETVTHPATCLLLNTAVMAVARRHSMA